jgi:hypothetical protein
MQYINGISEVATPILIILPVILMVLAGYAVGGIISRVRKTKSKVLTDFTSGSIILIFLFIFGFIIFGVIGSIVKEYFFSFTVVLVVLSMIAAFFLLKSLSHGFKEIKNNYTSLAVISKIFVITLFATLIIFNAIIIYHHPIFLEYDPVNNYLLTSKSILLGNGLNHDYYGGVDVHLRSPPLINAINAWIMNNFGYSSLRLFPIYFVFISSLYVYQLSKRVTNDSFLGWIASAAFLITPGILISNSHFSLYPDLSFMLFLIASFYFLAQVIAQMKSTKKDLLMLMISLSTMILSKELGLILTWAILFVVLYVKFSSGNRKIRAIYSVAVFLPFYLLAINDFRYYGVTTHTTFRLIEMSLGSVGLFYLLSHLTKGERSLLGFRNFIYFIPLLVPVIFLAVNIVDIHGPYTAYVFSDSLNKSMDSYKTLMGFQDKHSRGLLDELQNIPRLDILFTATLLGTLFIFFKLIGFITIIRKFKVNADYTAILIMLILQLTVWAYLDLGTNPTDIRHISYFAPIFAVILVIGLRKRTIPYKLFYYGIIVVSTYYFIFNDLLMPKFNEYFGGFMLDPQKDPKITMLGLEWAALLILILFVIELKEPNLIHYFSKIKLPRFLAKKYIFSIIVAFFILFGLNIYVLSTSGVVLDPPKKIDLIAPTGWEINEQEVIDFLNHNEKGNVLSLQNQAISFFTNRTSFELFDTHTFSSMSPLLHIENSSTFKKKISDMNIKYFVFPNENSMLYNKTKRFSQMYNITNILEHDASFQKVILKSHNIYKFTGLVRN